MNSRALKRGVYGGLAGGVVFGVMMGMMGMAAIAAMFVSSSMITIQAHGNNSVPTLMVKPLVMSLVGLSLHPKMETVSLLQQLKMEPMEVDMFASTSMMTRLGCSSVPTLTAKPYRISPAGR